MKMDQEAIKKIIPHRPPMLLVDTVEEMELGKNIVTRFHVIPIGRSSRAISPALRFCPASTPSSHGPGRRCAAAEL